MIQIFNNILYYLNLAALLHYQQEGLNNSSVIFEDNATTTSLPPVLVKQIPPGPILPGIVVKFVCAVNSSSGGSSICGSTAAQNEVSYQWEMYRYTEDKNGTTNCTSVKLPGQEAEMEIKFNETVADPKTHCDLVCTITNNLPAAPPSSASIKLHFLNKDNPRYQALPPAPPSNFKVLDATSRAAYFSWSPSRHMRVDYNDSSSTVNFPEITSYVIEYKNGRGNGDWRTKVSRYEIKDGSTYAACVSSLSPWTTYHFRIISYSKNVSSTPSWPIIVRTAEDFPEAPPTEIKVQAIKENMLQVSWKPPPRTTWNGALLGYNIGLKKASSDDDEPYVIYILHPLEPLGNLYSYRITVSDATVQYKVVVRAFNNIGNGPFSEPVIQQQIEQEK